MGSCSSAPKVAAGLGGGGEESSTGKNPYLVSTDEDGGGSRREQRDGVSGGEGNAPGGASSAGDDGLTDLSQFKRDYSGRGQAGIATGGGGKRGRKNKRAKAKDADMENLLNKYKRQGGAPSSATKNHLILQREELPGMGVVRKDADPFAQPPSAAARDGGGATPEEPAAEPAAPEEPAAGESHQQEPAEPFEPPPFSLPPPEPDEFDQDDTVWGAEDTGDARHEQRTLASFAGGGAPDYAGGGGDFTGGAGAAAYEEQVVEFHDVT